ncbi:MAG: acyloxyacyl hydrolase [Deltaproteobacteria bacterium]|nr:acyloxyacyl hydrolase [Deltaproteobacteria bacterium]MBW2138720.1 acyloxyacyl hydrolase [Deltaproteobacteria bacterium]
MSSKILLRVLPFAILVTIFLAPPAFSGERDVDTSLEPFEKGEISLQFVSGYLHSPIFRKKERPTLDYWQNNLRLGYMGTDILKENSFMRGNIQGLFEITYSAIVKGPGDYMAGITLLLRYNLLQPGWRLIPYVQLGAGVIYNDIHREDSQGLVGQSLEFTPQASAGLRYLINKNWSVDLEAMFHHVSNAGLDDRNIGVNSGGGFLGLTYYFDNHP